MSRYIKTPGPDHPITITSSGDHVVVRGGGATIADSHSTLVLREANYPPVRYIPIADVDRSQLTASELATYCPYKGEASYYSITPDLERGTDAVWFYADPHPAVAEIKDHVVLFRPHPALGRGGGRRRGLSADAHTNHPIDTAQAGQTLAAGATAPGERASCSTPRASNSSAPTA